MTGTATYIDVTPEQGARFFGTPTNGSGDGEIVMLNLLRFRDRADYSHAPELEPEGGASGEQAYALYKDGIEPLLEASGGRLLFAGRAGAFLIGPTDEHWDYVMLVQQASKQSFMAFASDPEAQTITQHRTAAIVDSRLLPIQPAVSTA